MKIKVFNYLQFAFRVLITVSLLNQVMCNAEEHKHDTGMVKKPIPCESTGLECANAATPYLSKNGELWLTWTSGGKVSIAKSSDFGKSFLPAKIVAQHGKFLDTGGDARPQIAITDKGKIIVAYAFFKDTQWNAQINTVQSLDGGLVFSEPTSIVKDTSSQRFPVLQVINGDSIFIAWIDKRIVAMSKKGSNPLLGGSVAYGWLNEEGVVPGNEVLANTNTCECCRIGLTLNTNQQPVLAYRAIFDGKIRDHAFQVALENKPGKIERIANDDWKTDICPHQGPSIAVSDSGKIHTTWYTQGNNRQGLFYASSTNSGSSFSEPRQIGDANANPSRAYLAASKQQVWMVWKEFDGQVAKIYGQYSSDAGNMWSAKKLLSQTSGYSDHPLLLKNQDKFYLSWLTRNDGYQFFPLDSK